MINKQTHDVETQKLVIIEQTARAYAAEQQLVEMNMRTVSAESELQQMKEAHSLLVSKHQALMIGIKEKNEDTKASLHASHKNKVEIRVERLRDAEKEIESLNKELYDAKDESIRQLSEMKSVCETQELKLRAFEIKLKKAQSAKNISHEIANNLQKTQFALCGVEDELIEEKRARSKVQVEFEAAHAELEKLKQEHGELKRRHVLVNRYLKI